MGYVSSLKGNNSCFPFCWGMFFAATYVKPFENPRFKNAASQKKHTAKSWKWGLLGSSSCWFPDFKAGKSRQKWSLPACTWALPVVHSLQCVRSRHLTPQQQGFFDKPSLREISNRPFHSGSAPRKGCRGGQNTLGTWTSSALSTKKKTAGKAQSNTDLCQCLLFVRRKIMCLFYAFQGYICQHLLRARPRKCFGEAEVLHIVLHLQSRENVASQLSESCFSWRKCRT